MGLGAIYTRRTAYIVCVPGAASHGCKGVSEFESPTRTLLFIKAERAKLCPYFIFETVFVLACHCAVSKLCKGT